MSSATGNRYLVGRMGGVRVLATGRALAVARAGGAQAQQRHAPLIARCAFALSHNQPDIARDNHSTTARQMRGPVSNAPAARRR